MCGHKVCGGGTSLLTSSQLVLDSLLDVGHVRLADRSLESGSKIGTKIGTKLLLWFRALVFLVSASENSI